ncbi:hypothetical protein [Ensifer canadensis]
MRTSPFSTIRSAGLPSTCTPRGSTGWNCGGSPPHLDLPLGDYRAELGAHGFTGTLTFEPFGNGSYALDPVSTLRRCLDAVAPHFNQAEQA